MLQVSRQKLARYLIDRAVSFVPAARRSGESLEVAIRADLKDVTDNIDGTESRREHSSRKVGRLTFGCWVFVPRQLVVPFRSALCPAIKYFSVLYVNDTQQKSGIFDHV